MRRFPLAPSELGTHCVGVGTCAGFDRLADMRGELDRILDSTPVGRNDFEGHATKRIYNLFAKTRIFDDLATHPVMLGVVEAMIGQAQLSAPTGMRFSTCSTTVGSRSTR